MFFYLKFVHFASHFLSHLSLPLDNIIDVFRKCILELHGEPWVEREDEFGNPMVRCHYDLVDCFLGRHGGALGRILRLLFAPDQTVLAELRLNCYRAYCSNIYLIVKFHPETLEKAADCEFTSAIR